MRKFSPAVFGAWLFVSFVGQSSLDANGSQPSAASTCAKDTAELYSVTAPSSEGVDSHSRPTTLAKRFSVYTLDDLIARAEAPHPHRGMQPTFFDYARDVEISKGWKGENGPRMFQDMLPEGVNFIDHALRDANEPGLVKVSAGDFTSLRVNIRDDQSGISFSTNIGVRKQALFDNIQRETKSLVSKDAKAVILWMHGGGTATTGHHVPVALQSGLAPDGIEVISFGMGWHDEAERKIFKSPRDYFEAVRFFMKKMILPAGVPVFLVGHSMGGEFADMYWRMYPKSEALVAGVIPLSSVPDLQPGKPIPEKVKALKEMYAKLGDNPHVAPDDKELMKGLMTQGKISPLGNWFESHFALTNSWQLPEATLQNPNPAKTIAENSVPVLYIWGEHDFLYQTAITPEGNLIDKHLKPFTNVQVKTYDVEKDYKGRAIQIGHLIFDHVDEKGRGAVVNDILNFIAQQGVKIERKDKAAELGQKKSSSLVQEQLQSYANNLAFREFVNVHHIRRKVSVDPAKLTELENRRKEIEVAQRELRQKMGPLKKLKDADNVAELERLTKEDKELGEELKRIQKIMMGQLIPEEGEEAALGKELLARIEHVKQGLRELENEHAAARTLLKDTGHAISLAERAERNAIETVSTPKLIELQNESENIRKEIIAAKKTENSSRVSELKNKLGEVNLLIQQTDRKVEQEKRAMFPSELADAEAATDEAFQRMQELFDAFDSENGEYYARAYANGASEISDENLLPSERLQALSVEYGKAYETYRQLKEQSQKVFQEEAQKGTLGPKLLAIYRTRFAAVEGSPQPLQVTYEKTLENMKDLEFRILQKSEEYGRLTAELINHFSGGYFRMEEIAVADIYNRPVSELAEHETILRLTWQDFTKIWRQRPPSESFSLY